MRKYLISLACLVTMGVLAFVLLSPWGKELSSNWPNSKKDKILSVEFSGGQNFTLHYENKRWYVKDGIYQSLADQRRVEFLLDQINRAKVFTELPEAAYGT